MKNGARTPLKSGKQFGEQTAGGSLILKVSNRRIPNHPKAALHRHYEKIDDYLFSTRSA